MPDTFRHIGIIWQESTVKSEVAIFNRLFDDQWRFIPAIEQGKMAASEQPADPVH